MVEMENRVSTCLQKPRRKMKIIYRGVGAISAHAIACGIGTSVEADSESGGGVGGGEEGGVRCWRGGGGGGASGSEEISSTTCSIEKRNGNCSKTNVG